MSRLQARWRAWPGGWLTKAAWVTTMAGVSLATNAWAAVPTTVAIEGRLMTAKGGPVADGTYAVTFALYPKQASQQASWTETVAQLEIKGGVFRHVLGSSKPLSASTLDAAKAGWLGVKVGNEPELIRRAVHAAPYALRAAIAEGIDCSGCISLAALKADGDLDLGGNAIKAAKISAPTIQASTITAQSFVGDGSKLTGVPMPKGACPKGQVLTGIGQAGKLLCAAGAAGGGDLESVSGGLLTTKYAAPVVSKTVPKDIEDNNPIGTFDEIVVPDVGKLQKFSVSVHITNSDVTGVELILYDPLNAKFELFKGGKGGKEVKETWPVTAKPISGNLGTWIGKNPKGKWRLRVVDKKFLNNGKDGKLESWSINVLSAAGNQVTSKGMFVAKGGFKVPVTAGPPTKCTAETNGHMYYDTKLKALHYCDGDWRKMLTESLCGNGVVNSDETCDDSNVKDGDECKANCTNVCKQKCSNGSCLDCNVAGQTLVKKSAFVDPNPPAGWTQCFGFLNTGADDVGPKAPDNCLNAKKLRMRIYDAGNNVHADVYGTVSIGLAAWPTSPKYITGSMSLAKCGVPMWPCGNKAGFYGSTNGHGAAGCSSFAKGGMNFSSGNSGQVTVAPSEPAAREIWHGPCKGNQQWQGYKAALYKQ